MEQGFSRFLKFLNEIKLLAGAIVLLPFFGANISSLVNWAETVYNLNSKLEEFVTINDAAQTVLDVLFFIEPAILNDITSLEFMIDDLVKKERNDIENQILLELRIQHKEKVLELERIRKRIKELDPLWSPGKTR